MASLKDTIISGSLRVTDTTYTSDLIIGASKTKNQFLGTPYNADGAPAFRALNAADIPTLSITDKTSGTLTVARGGTGLTTASYKNAIITGNGTTVTNAFTVVRTGSGALYATAQDGAAVFGTLPVAQGGTGATSFTANSLIMSGSTTTAALTTRAIYDRTSVNALNAASSWSNSTDIPTLNTIAYWDGRYQTTSNKSNLKYLGTVSGGTWQASTIGLAYGGTGATNAADAKANLGLGHIFYGTCDTAAATVDKVVTCSEFTKTAPDIGDVLFVKFTYTNSGARANLNLQIGDKANTKKPLRWLNNAGVASIPGNGYIVANHTYEFYYDGTNWIIDLQYDSNTNDTATLIRDYGGNVAIVTTTTALYYCELLFSVVDTNNGWKAIPANTTKKGHGSTAKTNIFTSEFNPFGNIYYYVTDADVAANATVRADRVYRQYPVDIRYSFNCGQTLTASKDVYLVAYMTGSCKAKLRNPGALDSNAAATATGANAGPITQTLPTSADGYIYIKLGPAYSNYQFDLTLDHPIYWHDGTSIRLYTPGTVINLNGTDYTGALASIYAPTTSGTSGYLLQSGGANTAPTWIQATNSNVASTIVKRDANGDFNARTVSLSGSLSVASGISMGQNAGIGITHNDTAYPVLVNYTNGNSGLNAMGGGVYMGYSNTVLMDWLNGKMTLNSSGDLSVTRYCTVNNRIYAKEWIQFDNWTGLYSPNNNAHFYPNNASSYGTWTINGSKNGYYGINLGPGTGYMTVMCDGSGNGGLFHEGSNWSVYYYKDGRRLGLGGSDTSSGYSVQVNGSLYVSSKFYAPSTCYTDSEIYCHSIWANRGSGEKILCADCSTSGTIYIYSNGSSKGIFANTGFCTGSYLAVNSSEVIFYATQYRARAGNAQLVSANGHKASIQSDRNFVIYDAGGGAVWSTGTNSSIKVKENIKSLDDYDLINFKKLHTISFNYKPEMKMMYNDKRYGLIAEEVLQLYPNLVRIPPEYSDEKFDINKGMNQYHITLDYEGFIPLLIKMVQKQQDEIDELKQKLKCD